MRLDTALRWTAHIWALLSTLTVLAFATGGNESLRMTLGETIGFLCFPIGMVIGFGVASWRQGIGGLITVASLALFYAWHISRTGTCPTGPWFLLLATPGFLHLASALVARRHGTAIRRA